MFTKMLVATDFSAVSEQAICALGSLKRVGTREAYLVHCFNIRDVGPLADRLMELAKPSLERQRRILIDLGFDVTAEMVLGLPQIEINRQAEAHNCSLVVVGATGGTMASEILLGGVASAVIHNATKPVLILRRKGKTLGEGEECVEWACDFLTHVLFPTDFSDHAEHAFAYVKRLAECGAKRVTLLHVQDQGRIGTHLKHRLAEFNEIDTARLSRLRDVLQAAGTKDVRIDLPYGSPKREVLARANAGDVSLVVMGSQGRGFLGEVFLGSVSHAVARRAEVPVLLVPKP